MSIFVEPNNSGTVSDFNEVFAYMAYEELKDFRYKGTADALGVPLLMPVFPRPASVYTQALSRAAMLTTGDMARLDLQLISMIEDARTRLETIGIHTSPKVFMHGFSASASFANRFTLMHPDRIKAVAIGGFGPLPILPASTYGGYTLRYPIGTADLKSMLNIDFDINTWKTVPQYFYMGDQEVADAVYAADCYDPEDAQILDAIFSHMMYPTRWNKCQELINGYGANAEFKLWSNEGHVISIAMADYYLKFFQKYN
jgi:pimeloyl-ACP methyl ester carboxylesterase